MADNPIKSIRVRFAPSPTGPFHIGNSRTAIFNWFFAKNHNGQFILRIEDTDKERSKPEFEEDIISGLKSLGLNWDEFYRQSERIEIYKKYLEKMLEEKKAYRCFCDKEQLEIERQAMFSQGLAPKYSGHCRYLKDEAINNLIKENKPFVVRLKVPEEGEVIFNDLIRGHIKFNLNLLGDIVVAKNLEEPLYNFSVVVDDILMKVSHVIRGEDHISNTPKQIIIFRALGAEEPIFAHLPLILNSDRSKMSKRYGDTELRLYLDDGYLPEAIVNFLTFLGWHPKEDKEVMTVSEIIKDFNLKRVQKAGAIFNIEKLNWFNKHYIASMDIHKLLEKTVKFVPSEWPLTIQILEAVRGRLTKLSELEKFVEFFFIRPDYPKELLFWKGKEEFTIENMKKLYEFIKESEEKDFLTMDYSLAIDCPLTISCPSTIEKKILGVIPENQKGDYLWPLRVALSGKEASPGPFEIMTALGKQESLERLQIAITKLEKE